VLSKLTLLRGRGAVGRFSGGTFRGEGVFFLVKKMKFSIKCSGKPFIPLPFLLPNISKKGYSETSLPPEKGTLLLVNRLCESFSRGEGKQFFFFPISVALEMNPPFSFGQNELADLFSPPK